MLAFLLCILGPFLFLITRTSLGKGKEQKLHLKRVLLYFHLCLISFYFLTLLAEKHNYYIKGYRSTSILFIIMTLSGIVYWFNDRDKVATHFLRLIAFSFTVVTTIFTSFLLFEMIGDYKNQLFYNDIKYRLEDTRRGINEPCLLPALFLKYSFYEQKFKPAENINSHCFIKSDISKIEIKQITVNQILVTYSISKDEKDALSQIEVIYSKE